MTALPLVGKNAEHKPYSSHHTDASPSKLLTSQNARRIIDLTPR